MTESGRVQDAVRSRKDLDRSLVHGIAWTGGVKWATQAIRWGSTLLIARLLSPDDYGLVGIATVYLSFVQLVNEFGLSSAIVQHRDLPSRTVAQLGGLSVMIGALLTLISAAGAPLIAAFFDAPDATQIIAALSVTFILRALQVVPKALLNRDLHFRQLAAVDGVEAVTLALSTLACALAGFAYWALVLGSLVSVVVATAMALVMRPHPIARPQEWLELRHSVQFGANQVVSRLAWFSFTNADFVVVGRVLGKGVLGAYSFGWTLANIPVERIASLAVRVTPAIFSTVQHEPAAIRRYLFALTEGLALITFPASLGLALVADEFVAVVLGPQWTAAVGPLRILSVYGAIRSVTALFPSILVATGRASTSTKINVFAAIVLPILFYFGARWGATGVALMWIVGYPLIVLPLFAHTSLKAIGASYAEFLRTLWPATVCVAAMAASVLLVRPLAETLSSPVIRLAVLVVAGAVGYAIPLLSVFRTRIREFRATIRGILKKGV